MPALRTIRRWKEGKHVENGQNGKRPMPLMLSRRRNEIQERKKKQTRKLKREKKVNSIHTAERRTFAPMDTQSTRPNQIIKTKCWQIYGTQNSIYSRDSSIVIHAQSSSSSEFNEGDTTHTHTLEMRCAKQFNEETATTTTTPSEFRTAATKRELAELDSEACVWRSISITRQINTFVGQWKLLIAAKKTTNDADKRWRCK